MSKNKEKHMLACARYMHSNAEKYGLNPEEMYILGFLHDIGYLFGKKHHAIAGKILLDKLGYNMSEFVKYHESTPSRYLKESGNSEIPNELILLWEADASVDYRGNIVGFDGRLADIGKRYGINSKAYLDTKENIDYIRSYNKIG